MGRRSLVFGPILLFLLILVLSRFKLAPNSTGATTPTRNPPRPSPSTKQAVLTTAETPQVNRAGHQPLISWSQVPPRIAMKALPLGVFGTKDSMATLDWNGVLSRDNFGREMGIPADIADLRRRAIGLVVALDGVLVRELPIELEQGSHTYPYEYFPTVTVIPKEMKDPAAVEEKLLTLLSGNLEGLAEKLPLVFQHPEAVDGLRNRALLLLGSVASSPQSIDFLRNAYYQGPAESRAAAAAALAYVGRDEGVREILEGTSDGALKLQALGALSNGFGKYYYRIEGERVITAWASWTPIARSQDAAIIDLSVRSEDPDVRRAAAMALLGRQENPRAKAAVLELLSNPQDPLLAFDLLNGGVLIDSSAEMTTAITRLMDSPHPYLRTMAVFTSAMISDVAVLDRLIPLMESPDPQVSRFALAALGHAGQADPVKAEEAMRAAAARRPQDRSFAEEIRHRIEELRPKRNLDQLREWLRQHPDHRLP